jgi:ABC-2 type transport system ATP-binding protein
MSTSLVTFEKVTKKYGRVTALDELDLELPTGRVIGLLGPNGSGKSTLLRHILGFHLPTKGKVSVFGQDSAKLGNPELARIGAVHQQDTMFFWMRVGQFLKYVSSFYKKWDLALQDRLIESLDIDTSARVGSLSPGNKQKLGLVAAVCHRPDLLLLDEPVSAMDIETRKAFFSFIFDLIGQNETTIVISSHVLSDVERIIDWAIFMEAGKAKLSEDFDTLRETFSEWQVFAGGRLLPDQFEEDFILKQEVTSRQARLWVRADHKLRDAFQKKHQVEVTSQSLSLEKIYELVLGVRTW